jgi:hypothetical protein
MSVKAGTTPPDSEGAGSAKASETCPTSRPLPARPVSAAVGLSPALRARIMTTRPGDSAAGYAVAAIRAWATLNGPTGWPRPAPTCGAVRHESFRTKPVARRRRAAILKLRQRERRSGSGHSVSRPTGRGDPIPSRPAGRFDPRAWHTVHLARPMPPAPANTVPRRWHASCPASVVPPAPRPHRPGGRLSGSGSVALFGRHEFCRVRLPFRAPALEPCRAASAWAGIPCRGRPLALCVSLHSVAQVVPDATDLKPPASRQVNSRRRVYVRHGRDGAYSRLSWESIG